MKATLQYDVHIVLTIPCGKFDVFKAEKDAFYHDRMDMRVMRRLRKDERFNVNIIADQPHIRVYIRGGWYSIPIAPVHTIEQ
jgi:hypothetical protein